MALALDNGAHGQAHFRVKIRERQMVSHMLIGMTGTQLGGKQVPASAGDKITMHCKPLFSFSSDV